MKKYSLLLATLMFLAVPAVQAAKCKGPDGNWYPYGSRECEPLFDHTHVPNKIPVPSDPTATYVMLEQAEDKKGLKILVTKRTGTAGTSYTKRIFNCNTGKFGTSGSAPTLDQMENNIDHQPIMIPASFIAADLLEYACLQ